MFFLRPKKLYFLYSCQWFQRNLFVDLFWSILISILFPLSFIVDLQLAVLIIVVRIVGNTGVLRSKSM